MSLLINSIKTVILFSNFILEIWFLEEGLTYATYVNLLKKEVNKAQKRICIRNFREKEKKELAFLRKNY